VQKKCKQKRLLKQTSKKENQQKNYTVGTIERYSLFCLKSKNEKSIRKGKKTGNGVSFRSRFFSSYSLNETSFLFFVFNHCFLFLFCFGFGFALLLTKWN